MQTKNDLKSKRDYEKRRARYNSRETITVVGINVSDATIKPSLGTKKRPVYEIIFIFQVGVVLENDVNARTKRVFMKEQYL